MALLAFTAAACAPTPRELIRKSQTAENPPGALSPFFETQFARHYQNWPSKPILRVCGYKAGCAEYEAAQAPAFFRELGAVRYSDPVVDTLVAEAVVSHGPAVNTAKGIVKRWLSCFSTQDDTRIYFFHSRNDEITSLPQTGYKHVNLYYLDATNAKAYEKLENTCGPMDKTTTIVFA